MRKDCDIVLVDEYKIYLLQADDNEVGTSRRGADLNPGSNPKRQKVIYKSYFCLRFPSCNSLNFGRPRNIWLGGKYFPD